MKVKTSRNCLSTIWGIVLLMVFALIPTAVSAQLQGSGTAADPYQISDYSDLRHMSSFINNINQSAHFKLMNDINLSSASSYQGFGSSSKPFKGVFDGNGHTIKSIILDIYNGDDSGLFRYTDGATIKNFSISGNMTISAPTKDIQHVGTIVGCAVGATKVLNVKSSVNITYQSTYDIKSVGGIVGWADGTTEVSNCVYNGTMTLKTNSAYDCLGGIVGYVNYQSSVKIANCTFAGTLNTTTNNGALHMGGILGYHNAGGKSNFGGIIDCLCYGSLVHPNYSGDGVGAIMGYGKEGAAVAGNITGSFFIKDRGAENAIGGSPAVAGTSFTLDQCKSGEAAWVMNGNVVGTKWRQNLYGDAYPTTDQTHSQVYKVKLYDCNGTKELSVSYNNVNENKVTSHGTKGYTPSYSWTGTDTDPNCLLTLKCINCGINVVDRQAVANKKRTAYTAATCTTAGSATFTATGTYTPTDATYKYSETVTESRTFPALGHAYDTNGFCHVTAGQTHAQAPSGSGTAASPYLISIPAHLVWFSNKVNGLEGETSVTNICGKLTKDIDMSCVAAFTPIGLYSDDNASYRKPFNGTFDGQGFTINNLTVYAPNTCEAGLFGRLQGTVTNLVLNKISVSATLSTKVATARIGGLAGLSHTGAAVRKCAVLGATLTERNNGKAYKGAFVGNYSQGAFAYNFTDYPTFFGDGAALTNHSCCFENVSAIKGTGELCWLLNGQRAGANGWYQTIGIDAVPVLAKTNSNTVYKVDTYQCDGRTIASSSYSNTNTTTRQPHVMVAYPAIAASCTTGGHDAYFTCTNACCQGKLYKDAAGTAVWDAVPTTEATGHHWQADHVCSGCNYQLSVATITKIVQELLRIE